MQVFQKMKLFSLAEPPSLEAELAIDELLLSHSERDGASVFRVWEMESPSIVLGRGSKVGEEIDSPACVNDNIRVLRRTSGGATILAGPGCLMYTLVLCHEDDSRLKSIDATHQFVLSETADALNLALKAKNEGSVVIAGTSDLAWQPAPNSGDLRKFSGNSMRRGRASTLYHGTILYDFDLDLISRYLKTAPRQPEYRVARDHREFVTNLPLDRQSIVDALRQAWKPGQPQHPTAEFLAEVDELVRSKYSQESWNLRH